MTARRTPAPNMLTVTAGRTTVGFILKRGAMFEAFDRAERSLGVFEDQRSAADAISAEVAR